MSTSNQRNFGTHNNRICSPNSEQPLRPEQSAQTTVKCIHHSSHSGTDTHHKSPPQPPHLFHNLNRVNYPSRRHIWKYNSRPRSRRAHLRGFTVPNSQTSRVRPPESDEETVKLRPFLRPLVKHCRSNRIPGACRVRRDAAVKKWGYEKCDPLECSVVVSDGLERSDNPL